MATLENLSQKLRGMFDRAGPGRPMKHGVFEALCLTLMKLRHNLTMRVMQALTGIHAVTISRYVLRVTKALGEFPLATGNAGASLIVDSTNVRTACREQSAYSGYKHHRCAKVRVIVREDGQIVDVSKSYPGAAHDKTIWNKEARRVLPRLRGKVLADKAYAGAIGEGEMLVRPVKRNETAWREDKDTAKAGNRALSKALVRIEHCFARLKVWKILSGLFPYRWTKLGDVVLALAVVHNVIRTPLRREL